MSIESAIGHSICILAKQCSASDPPLSPEEVLQQMRRITSKGNVSFQSFEQALLKTQKSYMKCIGFLCQFPEKDRALIHQLITSQMKFHRFTEFLPLLSNDRHLQRQVSQRTQDANVESSLLRRALRKTSDLDMDVFKEFEELIHTRERIKADYFFSNGWHNLVLDGKVQDAFDKILREALPKSPTCWQWICNCFKFY